MIDSDNSKKTTILSNLTGTDFSCPRNSENSINSDNGDDFLKNYIQPTDVIYIAGPMTGKPLFNYPAFFGFAGLIEKEFGCRVLNPARQPNGLEYAEYMRRAIADLKTATMAVFLDGWAKSPGARTEFVFCARNKIETMFESQIKLLLERRLGANVEKL